MRFVCFLFNFGPNSLKLLGLIIEANFMGYSVAVFFVVTNSGCSCRDEFSSGCGAGWMGLYSITF